MRLNGNKCRPNEYLVLSCNTDSCTLTKLTVRCMECLFMQFIYIEDLRFCITTVMRLLYLILMGKNVVTNLQRQNLYSQRHTYSPSAFQ